MHALYEAGGRQVHHFEECAPIVEGSKQVLTTKRSALLWMTH